MKQILTIILACMSLVAFADDVKIDKNNCTITKNGKTYPLYGEVKVVEAGSADLTVKVVNGGSCDLEVKVINNGTVSSCGEWKMITSGTCDFTVRFVESGSADIEIKFIENGTSGIYR